MFSQADVILSTGGGIWSGGFGQGWGVWSEGGGCLVRGGQSFFRGVSHCSEGVLHFRDPPMRSMHGRYASYWNAFLLVESLETVISQLESRNPRLVTLLIDFMNNRLSEKKQQG